MMPEQGRIEAPLGLIRGRLVPCVSPARFLNLEPDDQTKWSNSVQYRLIVIGEGQSRLAIPANEVQSVHRFSMSELKKPPLTLAKSGHITGILEWNGKAVGYIDPKLLMDFLKRSL